MNSPRFFDVYVFVLNSNSVTKTIFHVCVFIHWDSPRDTESFSLRSCRSSSVIVFDFWEGSLAGILRIFSDPQNKGSTFWGKLRCIFREKFRSTKKICRVKFVLQTCRDREYQSQGFRSQGFPKGPKIENFQDLEIFKRDGKFQAHCPPDAYFLWGILEGRDSNFQSRLKFPSGIENFNRD